jgi:predicted site-specific integrase-resolvase
MATSRRAVLYVRVSTSDRGQTVENQLQPLQEAAGRLGWTVVAIYRDEGISGSRGRDKRPGLDALLKGDRFRSASYKRTFLRDPPIGSDYVLKPAVQRPRTQSRNPRLDCAGAGRVLGDF